MDPLTHTLVGANLSATSLGEKTRFAAAALIIGANLPDIDGICYAIDPDLALYFRRGWTHGVLAMVVLPLLLAAILLLAARSRPDPARQARFGWLLLLSSIGVLSHPALDWLNTYGVRLLMPFDGRWFYGDAVYIMDPWLWLVLGGGYLAGRRPTPLLITAAVVIGSWTVRTVLRRSPEHAPLLIGIVIIFAIALFWRRPLKSPVLVRRLSAAALIVATIYILGRVTTNELTERAIAAEVAEGGSVATRMMAAPDPIDPRKWSVVVRIGAVYRYGEYRWGRGLTLSDATVPVALESEEWQAARRDPSVRGLVTWLRFPSYEIERRGDETRVHIVDARRSGAGRRAVVRIDGSR